MFQDSIDNAHLVAVVLHESAGDEHMVLHAILVTARLLEHLQEWKGVEEE